MARQTNVTVLIRARDLTRAAFRSFRGGLGGVTSAFRSARFGAGAFAAALAAIGVRAAIREFRNIVNEATAFEQALTGVAKTVQAPAAQIAALGEEFQRMAVRIPVAANELARIGQIAGQLGVRTNNIAEFVETIAGLEVATNLTSEEAATTLARFINIMQLAQSDVDRLGASVVDLGNNFATTEREILDMSIRIASAAKVVNLSAGDVLGLSTALSAIGVQSELGGTAITKLLISLQGFVTSGGSELEQFAKTAGTSVGEFRDLFLNEPIEALLLFIEGLREFSAEGGNVGALLDSLGQDGARLDRVLLGIASASNVTRDAVETGNRAYEENVALLNEANRFYDTTAARITTLKNRFTELRVEIGTDLFDAIDDLIAVFKEVDFRALAADIADALEVLIRFTGWVVRLYEATRRFERSVERGLLVGVGDPDEIAERLRSTLDPNILVQLVNATGKEVERLQDILREDIQFESLDDLQYDLALVGDAIERRRVQIQRDQDFIDNRHRSVNATRQQQRIAQYNLEIEQLERLRDVLFTGVRADFQRREERFGPRPPDPPQVDRDPPDVISDEEKERLEDLREIVADIETEMAAARSEAELMGEGFDALEGQASALERGIGKLLRENVSLDENIAGTGESIRNYAEQWHALTGQIEDAELQAERLAIIENVEQELATLDRLALSLGEDAASAEDSANVLQQGIAELFATGADYTTQIEGTETGILDLVSAWQELREEIEKTTEAQKAQAEEERRVQSLQQAVNGIIARGRGRLAEYTFQRQLVATALADEAISADKAQQAYRALELSFGLVTEGIFSIDNQFSLLSGAASSFANEMGRAFELVAEGSISVAQAFGNAFLGAISSVARGLGELFLVEAAGAIARGLLGDPKAFAAAAQFTAAAAAAFAVAGLLSGAQAGGRGGGGGGGSGGSGIAARSEVDLTSTDNLAPNVLNITGGPFIDLTNPQTEQQLKDALEELSGRRVVINRIGG